MLLAVYGASKLPLQAFEEGIANAATAVPNAPVLVTVFLSGGADALSQMFPAGDPLYAQYRPTLKLDSTTATPFTEDARLFWHPSLAPIAQLYGEGKVTVMPSIGYDHPDQSHFTSRHYWEVGAVDPTQMTGWMGRFLDIAGTPDNPLQGLALDSRLSPALASANVPVAAIDATDTYTFDTPGVNDVVSRRVLEALGSLAIRPTVSPRSPRHRWPSSAPPSCAHSSRRSTRRARSPFPRRTRSSTARSRSASPASPG